MEVTRWNPMLACQLLWGTWSAILDEVPLTETLGGMSVFGSARSRCETPSSFPVFGHPFTLLGLETAVLRLARIGE